MVIWRDGAMTSTQTDHSNAGTSDVVQLGLFESNEPEARSFVHPNHQRFAALLARAPADEDVALEVLALLEPELEVLARRLVRFGIELDVARVEALSVAWEVVAGHRLGPVIQTKVCLASVVWTELRREFGVRRDRGIELVPLTDEIDVATPYPDPPDRWPRLLEGAVAAGVLNPHRALVVAQTRIDGRSLAEVAAELGRPYHAVRKDRRRAEKALAAFARFYDAEGRR
jgi:hypothetical protein